MLQSNYPLFRQKSVENFYKLATVESQTQSTVLEWDSNLENDGILDTSMSNYLLTETQLHGNLDVFGNNFVEKSSSALNVEFESNT